MLMGVELIYLSQICMLQKKISFYCFYVYLFFTISLFYNKKILKTAYKTKIVIHKVNNVYFDLYIYIYIFINLSMRSFDFIIILLI